MSVALPIFELPLVLLPGERVPLHIFEDRYKQMIESALETGDPFGIVLRDAEGARSRGCTAHVTEVLKRYEDGRLDIVATGGQPFRIVDRFGDPEQPSADVELVDADESRADPDDSEAAAKAFADLAERATGERPDSEELFGASAYELAGRIELPTETKQELLALNDEAERMRLLLRVLQALEETIDRAGDAAARARSNGKVRLGGGG